jgi:hypothetical protein
MAISTRNPHAVNNVNVKQGPRTGNHASSTKRNEFKAAKEERAPLADMIEKAYGARAQKDFVTEKLEPISSNTKAKFKK